MLGLHFCARAFSSCSEQGPLFIAVRGPLTIAASVVVENRFQTRSLSNCGSQAQLLRGMWDLPRSGLEPVSPALAGRFSTTPPPGKPYSDIFDGVYILEVNQSQKKGQIHMSFLNAWLFHIFKLCPGINIFLTKGCFKYNFSVSFKSVADQILWKRTRLYDSLLVKVGVKGELPNGYLKRLLSPQLSKHDGCSLGQRFILFSSGYLCRWGKLSNAAVFSVILIINDHSVWHVLIIPAISFSLY